ncbi:hypothetical protein [Nocardia salmonicida]|uniref:hypothetical protein n=1 Tax=Nocardia salmonicida TaxID=53431 RepID=UPI0007A4D468|nr:hypothetical protein [Nocardia salmonicida]MBC7299814.1 hypothetical protein [Nocardia sp.]
MTLIATLAAVALIGLAVWRYAPLVARVVGAALMALSAIGLVTGLAPLGALVPLMLGLVLWLIGHLLTAYRKNSWKSRIAFAFFDRTPLYVLDPLYRAKRRRQRAKERDLNAQKRREQRDERAEQRREQRRGRAAERRAMRQADGAARHNEPLSDDDFRLWEAELDVPDPRTDRHQA